MNVEARYAKGAGVLVGSGAHWVLLTDPGDERVVQDIWDALSLTAPSGAGVVERVLAIAEKAFEGDPPGLALVDFTSGASTTLSRFSWVLLGSLMTPPVSCGYRDEDIERHSPVKTSAAHRSRKAPLRSGYACLAT